MGAFGNAMRGANISGEIREGDETLVAAMVKLKSITDMFISSYGEIVIEMFASPMDIVQRKLSEVSEITIYVLHDRLADESIIDGAKEMLDYLVRDEFEDVKNGVDVKFKKCYDKDVAALCLYSLFPIDSYRLLESELGDDYYVLLADMVFNRGLTVSVPVNVASQSPKTMFIHCGTTEGIVSLDSIMSSYGVQAKRYSDKLRVKDCGIVYVPMLSQRPMPNNLPYAYVDTSVFNQQHLESVLNKAQN